MEHYGYKEGNMMAHVENYQKPESAYSQKYDQSPLNYIERQDYKQGHDASMLRAEAFKYGRYDK